MAHTSFSQANEDSGPGSCRPPQPSRRGDSDDTKVAIVTCMDARIDPAQRLGLKDGEAHVIRNAGGSVQEAMRSLIVSQYALQTNEIAIFHHTGCGMTVQPVSVCDVCGNPPTPRDDPGEEENDRKKEGDDAEIPPRMTGFNGPALREELYRALRQNQASGFYWNEIEQMNFFEQAPPRESVQSDVARLRRHPLFKSTIITGWVHDVRSGRISLVVPCEDSGCKTCPNETANTESNNDASAQ